MTEVSPLLSIPGCCENFDQEYYVSSIYSCTGFSSFNTVVEFFVCGYSMTVLNDTIKPNVNIFLRLVFEWHKCLVHSATGDNVLILWPERHINQHINSSLYRFLLNVVTIQIHLPSVRLLPRLTKDKKHIGNASPIGDDLPRSCDFAEREYFLPLVKRFHARQRAQGILTCSLGRHVSQFRWGGIVPVWCSINQSWDWCYRTSHAALYALREIRTAPVVMTSIRYFMMPWGIMSALHDLLGREYLAWTRCSHILDGTAHVR